MELVFAVIWLVLLAMFAVRLATGRKREETIDRGRELLMAGMPERAVRVFERLARQRSFNAPGRERALYWLARTHEELGDAEKARTIYKQYLTQYGTSGEAEVQQLVRHRLRRLQNPSSEQHVPEVNQTEWARYKAERDALLVKVKEKHEPQIHVEPIVPTELIPDTPVKARLVTPPEAELVSPEKIAKDLHAISAGRRLGEYVLAEKLGEGGFGEVYRALRPVAIKLARDPSVVEHLRRFGTIQSQVKSDRVVKPLEVNLDADPPYVVMELVDGCTLRDLLETKEIKDGEALAILREVALGLRDAHEAGVLHLDLKPENVLVDESGKVKLTDFELGKVNEAAAQLRLSRSLGTKEEDAKIAGTIAYMSPEQRDGKVPDARSDVYTYGVLLFEALTGEHPQPGDKISDFRKDLAHVAELDRVFERCFTRHERRYASARELAKDVEWICERLPQADLAALMRAAPRARDRVAQRALPRAEAPKSLASEVRALDKAAEKPPADPEPSAAEKAAADALIAARAAAARETPRPPIPVETPPPPVRPPIPVVESAPPEAPAAPRVADKPQLEAG